MAAKEPRSGRESNGQGGQRTGAEAQRKPFETLRALALAVVLALGIRAFIVEPFKIPSGSMIPTLLVGDYILVNKFAYGIREPFSGRLLLGLGEPERGDVMVFRYPDDPRIDYIKRVVGLPGDLVEIREGRLWVNGQVVDRVSEGEYSYFDYVHDKDVIKRRYRELAQNGAEYTVIRNLRPTNVMQSPRWRVPPDRYFMMGDNRDNSRDSRLWNNPYVSPEQVKGKAFRVHWSWVVGGGQSAERGFIVDFLNTVWRVISFQIEEVRWERVGRKVDGPAD
jgi:signal peptidase I